MATWAPEMSDGPTRRRGTGTIDPDVLERLVETVVRTADPERVILFGSAARGELTDDSDMDILVVKDQCQPLELAGDIQVALPAEMHPVDIIVVWPEDLEIYEDTTWRPISSALREGQTLYVKRAPDRDFLHHRLPAYLDKPRPAVHAPAVCTR